MNKFIIFNSISHFSHVIITGGVMQWEICQKKEQEREEKEFENHILKY